ncbi:hypothetical protein [Paracoccus sp. (in: a-proteobacteria)]|uniref:hypothetical protein n=1 Tax=Paracoccus sp. TaxID=267 RepID=UPI0028A0E83A|nr:hypothetical protein [Paracoccus sp. (in: a-proteobacteria)]
MDFNNFDSRTAADEGRPMHIKHPATGELMWNDDGPKHDDDGNELPRSNPCRVYVYGTEGNVAQEAFREAAKLDKLDDAATMADYHERLCVTARKLVAGFENVNNGDRPATVGDAAWFLNLNTSSPLKGREGQSFAEQVLQFSGTRGQYLGKPEADLSPPRIKSAGSARGRKNGSSRAAKI